MYSMICQVIAKHLPPIDAALLKKWAILDQTVNESYDQEGILKHQRLMTLYQTYFLIL